jgi:acetyltransferase-like isoleucine patch superfamily enzyme
VDELKIFSSDPMSQIENFLISTKWRRTYWFMIFCANLTGKIPIHTVRLTFLRSIFRVKFPKDSIIYCGCRFFHPWGVSLGHNSIVGNDAFLDGRFALKIGSNVNIAGEVRIYTLEHDIASPTFGGCGGPVWIQDWVYIGTRVTILPGVTIGEGAVIASGAVVAKDVAPWTMVGGVPATFIKNRPVVQYTLDTKNRAYFQ